jgi:hypothetical protein
MLQDVPEIEEKKRNEIELFHSTFLGLLPTLLLIVIISDAFPSCHPA